MQIEYGIEGCGIYGDFAVQILSLQGKKFFLEITLPNITLFFRTEHYNPEELIKYMKTKRKYSLIIGKMQDKIVELQWNIEHGTCFIWVNRDKEQNIQIEMNKKDYIQFRKALRKLAQDMQ